MGSTKKHKKDRDSKKHKNRSRSRSPPPGDSPDRDRDRRHKKRSRRERSRSQERKRDYHSDSSDVVEVPLDLPVEKQPRARPRDVPTPPPPPSFRDKSPSPIPEGGLGDSLSIEETNKLRAKLGLKPLEVSSAPSKPSSSSQQKDTSDISEDESKITDDLGEFYHKPAANITELKNAEKIREKIKERREKRKLEENLKKTKTLGESDSDDDVNNWVERNRLKALQKKEAEKRAKLLEEMDEEFGVGALMEEQSARQGGKKRDLQRQQRRGHDEYKYSSLRGLKVEHDVSEFTEGRTMILTLKDADVLDEEAKDTLVNVNIVDTERYRKNVENKKHRPGGSYGYECYEDGEEEELGSHRSVLKKYDDEIAGASKKSSFVIGSTAELEKEQQRRKMMEIKCKLENKRIVSLNEQLIRPATDYFTEEEMAKFKKPKKRKEGKKLRAKLKADDLLPLPGDVPESSNLRSRRGRQESYGELEGDDDEEAINGGGPKREWKLEPEEDLERVLSKARRLKQKEALICKAVKVEIKEEVRNEDEEDGEQEGLPLLDSKIVLNETAEFCRTLGDIPTYGMAGNREADLNDMMDVEEEDGVGVSDEQLLKEMEMEGDEEKEERGGAGGSRRRGQWSSVAAEDQDGEEEYDKMDLDVAKPEGQTEKAVLDDEPDVGTGVAGALRLAMSKGYLEKEEANKPSNTRMAYLQAKNYSIDDKAQNDDDKFSRQRDRYHTGPVSEFRDKDGYKPNVKLDYIDDNGRILNAKEAFRYLSHKFHGKGPGKNKIEKRLKKVEQEGLMKQMSSTDTPLGTLNMLQAKQKETNSPFIILSGGKQSMNSGSIGKPKMN